MIELAFVACLASAPTDCRTEHMQFIDISMMTCMVGAQAQIAVWHQTHPDRVIRKWTCRTLDLTSPEI